MIVQVMLKKKRLIALSSSSSGWPAGSQAPIALRYCGTNILSALTFRLSHAERTTPRNGRCETPVLLPSVTAVSGLSVCGTYDVIGADGDTWSSRRMLVSTTFTCPLV